MPDFMLNAPDGRKFKLTVPEGTSQDEVMQRAGALFNAPRTGEVRAPSAAESMQALMSRGATPLTPGGASVSPLKTLGEAATDPEVLLGTAGEIGGAMIPVPGASMAGATVGGGAGRMLKNVAGGQPTMQGVPGAAAGQGAGSAAGRVLATGGTMAKRALTGTGPTRETAEAVAARTFLEPRLAKTGVTLAMTPAEATDSAILDLGQNIAEGGFFSRGRMQSYFDNRRAGLKTIAEDLANDVAPSLPPEQLAELFRVGVEGRNAAAMVTSSGMRQQFESQAGHIVAQTGKLRALASDVIKASERRGHVESVREGVPLAEQILDLPPTTTVSDLAKMRSSLLAAKRGLMAGEKIPLGKRRVIDKLVKEVDGLITSSVKDPDALKLWRESNALVAERAGTTESPFMRRLVRISDPSKLGVKGGGGGGDALVDTVFKNENSIRATQRALGGTDVPEYKQLQRRYLERRFADATDGEGNINGEKFIDALTGKGNQAEQRFIAGFPSPNTREDLFKFGQALKTIQKQTGDAGGSGKMLIQLTQGGALFGALSGAADASTIASVLIAPNVLAEMMTHRIPARLLIQTLQTDPKSRLAASLISRIAVVARDIEQQRAMDDFLERVPTAGQGSLATAPGVPRQ